MSEISKSPNEIVDATNHERVFTSPLARRVAREHGIDTQSIVGSGPDGRIVRRDVEALIGNIPIAVITPVEVASSNGEEILIPHSRMLKAVAGRLTDSKSSVPHFYLTAPVHVDELLNLRKKFNEWAPIKISVTDLLLKVVAEAFCDVPTANVIWADEALTQFSDVDISVAVAIDKGFLTPVVRRVNKLSLVDLGRCTNDLIARARDGKLKQDEIEGGSFSITNLGMYGTDQFTAILNPPQAMILAVGSAKPAPVVIKGEIKIATIMNLTLSVDHRAIDGALAAQWFAAFVKRCENPLWMLL